MAINSFHIVDYVVFGITIVISIGIGLYYALSGGKQKTTAEYLVGGRTMTYLPVAISLMVSFESSVMMLGLPAEAYVYGLQWNWSVFGFLISQILAIHIVVPLLHPLKLTSAYEYLEYRYKSKAVRRLGTILGMLSYIWYMGVVLYGPAVALEAVTNFSLWTSIFVISFVAVIYTSIGGLKAVIWTDVFQAVIMFMGVFAVLIKGTMDTGGPAQVWNLAERAGRMNFFNFSPDPRVRHTFWNLFVGSIFRGFSFIFNQSTVQRISSTRSQSEAKRMLITVAPCFFVTLILASYKGVVMYSYYDTIGCDPLKSGQITNPNQLIPFFVMDIFTSAPGMPGLFLAALFSASLSTLSSGLSSLSAMVWSDVVHPLVGDISELKATLIAKGSDVQRLQQSCPARLQRPVPIVFLVFLSFGNLVLCLPYLAGRASKYTCAFSKAELSIGVVLFGLLASVVAILVSQVGGTLIQISGSLISAFSGPLTGLFFLACFFPRANAKGTIFGGITSFALCSWISMGMSFNPNVKTTPMLSPASTDRCHLGINVTGSTRIDDVNSTVLNLYTTTAAGIFDNVTGVVMTTILPAEKGELHGIEQIYNLSYQWLSTLGMVTTIVVGLIASICTGWNKPIDVDRRYIISFTDAIVAFLPRKLRQNFTPEKVRFQSDTIKKETNNSFLDSTDDGSKKLSPLQITIVVVNSQAHTESKDTSKHKEATTAVNNPPAPITTSDLPIDSESQVANGGAVARVGHQNRAFTDEVFSRL